MLIARTWRGETAAARADDYLAYLHQTGLADYQAIPGNRGVIVGRRVEGDRAIFVLTSFWDSYEAIRAFAGERPERARYYPEDDAYLLFREPTVMHAEVVFHALSLPSVVDGGDSV